ncbi:MAG: SH3 domain-containing protein [Lachnospiraceae bacterium]|nr:SH3 domain-containing protein [Lachnospiraceae bacterium]
MNKSNSGILEFFDGFKKWLVKYSKIVLPIILVVCVGLTIVIAIRANKRKVEQEEAAVASEDSTEGTAIEVPDVPLEQDAVPEINELFSSYYTAMVDGDTDTMGDLVYYLDANEILKAKETSKYLESFSTLEVYTKPGPREGTYVAYVYVDLKFTDYEKPIPGMRVYYVCSNEDGAYYINEDGDEGDDELRYMRELQKQEDVIDLNNKAAVAFNDMVAEDKSLADFLVKLNEEIEKNVGETLARAEEIENAEGENAEGEGEEPEETAAEEPEVVVTRVKAVDVVNIRTSDSETADKLGKAAVGDEFELLEEKGNGWSKIRYNDGDAYIKSEFLEPSETQTASNEEQNEEPEEEEAPQQTASSTTAAETVTVKETVKIRKGASTSSDQLATVYKGDKLEVLMKQADGWTRIKYDGNTAYVKSEFVE